MLAWVFLVMISQTGAVISIMAEPPSLKLEAMNCKTGHISYSRADDFCSNSRNVMHRPLARITLAERVSGQAVRAIRCTKTVSESSHMCAAFSHMKLVAPPKYAVVTEITPQECKSIHLSGLYSDGVTYPIAINSVLQYQKVQKGKLTLTANNVRCDGEQSWVGNILHDQIMQFTDVKIEIQEVTMELNFETRTASDVTNRRELDESCYLSKMCLSNNESYVRLEEVDMCRVKRVKTLKVEEYTVNTDKGKTDLVVSHEDKIAIEKRSPLVPSSECERNVAKYYATNIDDLLIIYERDMGKEKLGKISAEGVSVRAQEVASSTYLSLMTVLKVEGLHTLTNDRICSTIANSVETIERSPFNPHAILKRKGDLILQIQCQAIEVTVTLGESVISHCLEGYLSVSHEGKPALISAGSHILYDGQDIETFPSIDCEKAPFFVTKDGQVIQQRPQVRVVNITLVKPGAFLDEAAMNEIRSVEVFNTDGLYTADQVHQFEDLIHWGRKRAMLQNIMIDKFCQDSSCLGTDRYNFEKYGTNSMGLMQSVMDWIKTSFWEKLQIVGSYASVLVLFVYVGQLISCMYTKLGNVLRFRQGQRKRHNSLHLGIENRTVHDVTQVQAVPEVMVMSELPTKVITGTQECACSYCRGVTHDKRLFWPRNTCGNSCCKYHLKSRCEPFEWCLLDPMNLAFDHSVEDQKHTLSVSSAVISLRSSCKCNKCLGKFSHPPFHYVSNACGCLRCEKCNTAEVERRKQLGLEYDMIFGSKNYERGNPQME